MEKRLFIAVMLSIAFLFAWAALLPRFFPQLAKAKKTAAERPAPVAPPSPSTTSAGTEGPQTSGSIQPDPPGVKPATRMPETSRPAQQASQIEEIEIKRPEYTARFSNRGAQLISFKLLQYKQKQSEEVMDLVRPRPAGSTDFPFSIVAADAQFQKRVNEALYVVEEKPANGSQQLTFRYSDPSGVSVVKTLEFTEPYLFDFSVQMSPNAPPYRVVIGPGIRALLPNEETDRYIRTGNGVVQVAGSFDIVPREKAPEFKVFEGTPEFIGIEDNYFLTVLQPSRSGEGSLRSVQLPTVKQGETRKELYAGLNAVSGVVSGKAFFGPKETQLLDNYGLGKALQFGVFGPIARGLLWALSWLYGFTHNYGWAIIVLTIIIKILLYPLQHKSIVSMKKMQKVQPKMTAIRDKYKKAKSDPEQRQKMNTEMMKLYQQEGINPASGCLPILLQLPILWAFYSLLSVAIELRGAEFEFWIKDLSSKDPYYITPILMTITMFIQTWMTPSTADPVQRKVFLAMPFVFGWIFKEMPSGLVLYWLVQNILSITQQAIMNKYWKQHPES